MFSLLYVMERTRHSYVWCAFLFATLVDVPQLFFAPYLFLLPTPYAFVVSLFAMLPLQYTVFEAVYATALYVVLKDSLTPWQAALYQLTMVHPFFVVLHPLFFWSFNRAEFRSH